MFGALKFYKECRKNGIKPIIGSEFYLAPDSRLSRTGGEKNIRYHHLVLLARNEQGYRNLLKLSSAGYTEGFYYKPRIDDELLEKYCRGLICLSGCQAGQIPRLLLENKPEEARGKAAFYRDLFGDGNFYLELQNHGIPEQKIIIKGLLRIAKETGIPLAASNDIHYAGKDDALAQDILICIGTNKKLTDEKRLKFEYPEFYFKSQEEMAGIFSGLPEALTNTLSIAEKCDLSIPLPGPLLPRYLVPEGYDLDSYLSEIARSGLEERYNPVTPSIRERLEYELSIIKSMGYTGYFLIVWDFIRFARQHGIPVGPGRGSGAGSLVAYSLRITDIDPLHYGLIFERFLNPERVSMPDFDIDFCYEGRNEVIDYVIGKYGKERVGQIITFGRLKARAVIRDVARVLDLPYAEADSIAKLVPQGPRIDLRAALKLDKELAKLAKQSDKHRQLIEASLKLEGFNRHASTHAAGIVIGREELTHYVPLYRDSRTGSISTQYTMDYLEECGLVKMDFLGLKTLTLINYTLELLKNRGIELKLAELPEDDAATFKLLGEGKSTCIFQFESQGMQEVLKRAAPESIKDLIALNALYRPGPMEFIDQFIDAKRGKKPIRYPLPELEEILKETYGVIVYQEQVIEIARKVAGFSLGEADIVRRVMGKKKPEAMPRLKIQFIDGAVKNGFTKKAAEKIFDLLVPFAGYGFNKSHAAAYSVLAYQTAYLKANYPAEFMAANLTNEINSTDKLSEYISETREMGIEILPPDINLSESDFAVMDDRIIYGLKGIKNVGAAAVDEILKERRQGGEYKGFVQFLERVDLKVINRKVVETLILCGVFERFDWNRATLFHNLDKTLEIVSETKESKKYGQVTLFEALESEGLPQINLEKVEEWPALELLNHEKQNLGFYFSGHPLDRYRTLIRNNVTLDLARVEATSSDRLHLLIGLFKDLKVINTKTGRRMAFGMLEDLAGSIELVIFPEIFKSSKELLTDGRILAVRGKIDTNRGEPKLIVEKVSLPEESGEHEAREVHVRIARDSGNEDNFLQLRDFMIERPGNCAVYFHFEKPVDRGEIVIKASTQIAVSAADEVLDAVRAYPQVKEVWKE